MASKSEASTIVYPPPSHDEPADVASGVPEASGEDYNPDDDLIDLADTGVQTDATPLSDILGEKLALVHAEDISSRKYGPGVRMMLRHIGVNGRPTGDDFIAVTFSQGVVRVITALLAKKGKVASEFRPAVGVTFSGSRETGFSVR